MRIVINNKSHLNQNMQFDLKQQLRQIKQRTFHY